MVRDIPRIEIHQSDGPQRRENRPLRTVRSGKSTLIRCINHLEPFEKGRIVVDGTALDDSTKTIDAVRREVGMVFQSFNLFPHMTVLENCALAPMRVRGTKEAEAESSPGNISNGSEFWIRLTNIRRS